MYGFNLAGVYDCYLKHHKMTLDGNHGNHMCTEWPLLLCGSGQGAWDGRGTSVKSSVITIYKSLHTDVMIVLSYHITGISFCKAASTDIRCAGTWPTKTSPSDTATAFLSILLPCSDEHIGTASTFGSSRNLSQQRHFNDLHVSASNAKLFSGKMEL